MTAPSIRPHVLDEDEWSAIRERVTDAAANQFCHTISIRIHDLADMVACIDALRHQREVLAQGLIDVNKHLRLSLGDMAPKSVCYAIAREALHKSRITEQQA